jgi:hypothetical protein
MTFWAWLRQQRGRPDAVGRFARAAKRWHVRPPAASTLGVYRDALRRRGNGPELMAALEAAWREFQALRPAPRPRP